MVREPAQLLLRIEGPWSAFYSIQRPKSASVRWRTSWREGSACQRWCPLSTQADSLVGHAEWDCGFGAKFFTLAASSAPRIPREGAWPSFEPWQRRKFGSSSTTAANLSRLWTPTGSHTSQLRVPTRVLLRVLRGWAEFHQAAGPWSRRWIHSTRILSWYQRTHRGNGIPFPCSSRRWRSCPPCSVHGWAMDGRHRLQFLTEHGRCNWNRDRPVAIEWEFNPAAGRL